MPLTFFDYRNSDILVRIRSWYRRLFSIAEIETNPTLQWFFGAMLLYFFSTFSQWISSPTLTVENAPYAVCWPYFQGCARLYFLRLMPYGYSQSIFYMALFGVMILIIYCMWRRQWVAAHALLLVLWLWKFFAVFVLSYTIGGVYDSYHLILTATLLFVPHKEYFAKVMFVFLYFLSSTVKFYPTWILGTYFTSLQLGVPLFPHAFTALITNTVIFEQVVGCWFLLSSNKIAQRLSLVYFTIFHLYAGILVLFDYSLISLPALLILFGPMYRHQYPPLTRKSIAGWSLLLIMVLFQLPAHIIPGDEKMTLEGYRFGMWMFDANHQCVVTFTSNYNPGVTRTAQSATTSPSFLCTNDLCLTSNHTYESAGIWMQTLQYESPNAEARCDPYTIWQEHRYLCNANVSRVSMQQDQAINGGPFYRIVDEANICNLNYQPFVHNSWIKEPPQAPLVGYSVKDPYYSY